MIKVNGVKTKLPVTKNITEHIKTLKYKKKILLVRYYDLYTELIKAKNIQDYEKEYTKLVDEINMIENEIDTSYMRIEELNRPFNKKLEKLEFKYEETKKMEIQEKIQKLKEDYIYIDYIIAEEADTIVIEQPVGIKKISADKKQVIKTKVKDLISQVFPFKNKKECLSKKKSEPYYLSKEQIINKIKQQPDIESSMPSKYSTMTKEKLCEQLFS
jgi:hypothetical protein